jgi:hypothetical protein
MPLLTPTLCRNGLATFLGTVTGVGQVHKQRRIMRDERGVKAVLWSPTTQIGANPVGWINGWMISPAGANTTVTERNPGHRGIGVAGGGQANLSTFQWQIEGYYGLDDANDTEQTFQDLAWTVTNTLNSYGGLFSGVTFQLPADIEQFGYAMVANWALLHYVRIGVGFRGQTQ